MRILFVVLLTLVPLASSPAWADDAGVGSVRVVDEDSGADPALLPVLAAQAAREYEKLKALFGADVGVVTVRVTSRGVARHLPPAAIVIPARLLRDGRAITAHEITHLLTQGWADGLLKEGLAVHAQDRVGESKGWPNEGRDVHRVAWETITRATAPVRGPADAGRVLATRNPDKPALRRAAYAVAGSWVTWLIDDKFAGDLGRFMTALYRSGDYRAALGRSFDELEREWRASLERFKR